MSKKRYQEKQRHRQKKTERQKSSIATQGLAALKRRVQAEAPFGDRKVVFQGGSSEKMSEVLEAFVEPYREHARTRDAYERLIVVGTVAWNAALLPKDGRQALLDDACKSVQESAGKENVEVFKALLNDLIKRKERYFADNHRFIVSYQVTETRGGFHLAVASTPAQSPQQDDRTGKS